MVIPETRYARTADGVSIAYAVIGDGPQDLVAVPGWISHLEAAWEEPTLARFYKRLATFSRLILFDKRGTGLSDRVPETQLPTLETRMDDLRTVCDAVGSDRAALLGVSEGAPMSILFAATYPARTTAVILVGGYARRLRAPDYPWGASPEAVEAFKEEIEQGWGVRSGWKLERRVGQRTLASGRRGPATCDSGQARQPWRPWCG